MSSARLHSPRRPGRRRQAQAATEYRPDARLAAECVAAQREPVRARTDRYAPTQPRGQCRSSCDHPAVAACSDSASSRSAPPRRCSARNTSNGNIGVFPVVERRCLAAEAQPSRAWPLNGGSVHRHGQGSGSRRPTAGLGGRPHDGGGAGPERCSSSRSPPVQVGQQPVGHPCVGACEYIWPGLPQNHRPQGQAVAELVDFLHQLGIGEHPTGLDHLTLLIRWPLVS